MTRETTTGSRRVSRGSVSTIAHFCCFGWYPTCETWTVGAAVKPGIAWGVTSHSTAPFVAPFATSERTTNQPLLCWPRPSTSSRPPPLTSSIAIRWLSDSGAMTSRFPVASGAIWYSPFASSVPGPFGWRGKMPACVSVAKDFPKRIPGNSSRLKPTRPTHSSGSGCSRSTRMRKAFPSGRTRTV